MGAWFFVDRKIEETLTLFKSKFKRPKYIGRDEAASPTGSYARHNEEQENIVKKSLEIENKKSKNKQRSRYYIKMNIEANMEDILLRTMPSAAKLIRENSLNINEIIGTGKEGRITKGDVLLYLKDKNLIVENNLNRQEKKISTDRKDNIMDIIVPTLGESIVEATVSKWLRKEGDYVEIDEPIVELETDKVTLEVPASMEGLIEKIDISEGETVEVGQVLGSIKKADKKPSPVEKRNTNKRNF